MITGGLGVLSRRLGQLKARFAIKRSRPFLSAATGFFPEP
jgi:hypothetical protein